VRPVRYDLTALRRIAVRLAAVNALADLVTFAVLYGPLHAHGSVGGQAVFRTGWFTENLLTQALAIRLLRDHRRRPWWAVRTGTIGLAVVGAGLPRSPLAGPLGMRPLPAVFLPVLAVVLAGFTVAVRRRSSPPDMPSPEAGSCRRRFSLR